MEFEADTLAALERELSKAMGEANIAMQDAVSAKGEDRVKALSVLSQYSQVSLQIAATIENMRPKVHELDSSDVENNHA